MSLLKQTKDVISLYCTTAANASNMFSYQWTKQRPSNVSRWWYGGCDVTDMYQRCGTVKHYQSGMHHLPLYFCLSGLLVRGGRGEVLTTCVLSTTYSQSFGDWLPTIKTAGRGENCPPAEASIIPGSSFKGSLNSVVLCLLSGRLLSTTPGSGGRAEGSVSVSAGISSCQMKEEIRT